MKLQNYKVKPYFEENLGQLPSDIKYKVKANGYTAFFKKDKLVVSLPSNLKNTKNIFCMELENINEDAEIEGENKQVGIINYFLGDDKSKWITHIPTYTKIKYKGIYNNIDLSYYINNENLEYDFILSKGANPEDISISFDGVDNIEIDEDNNIVLSIGDIKAKLLKPEVYQIIDNTKINIECEYQLDKNNCINFLMSEYEKEYELVLDPVLVLDYSTYIGEKVEYIASMKIDSLGNGYIAGQTATGYPTTVGAYQTTIGGGTYDGFVTKLSSDGSSLIYSTYIGGSSSDCIYGLDIDSENCAYIAGVTSGYYPVTKGVFQPFFRGGSYDGFVTKLSSDGSSLEYSTYLGGTGEDCLRSICVDSTGCAYVTGYGEMTYPITSGAYQMDYGGGAYDAVVSKLNKDGSRLVYSTYLGGSGMDIGEAIVVDSQGYAYITGSAEEGFPIIEYCINDFFGGGHDAFVSKLSKDGATLVFSTYLGGAGLDAGYGIAIDSKQCVYVTGSTTSYNFPITINAYQTIRAGSEYMFDCFVTKLNRDATSFIYSTFLGGHLDDVGYAISVDSLGCAYITGYTASDDFPIVKGAYKDDNTHSVEAFVSKLNLDGSALLLSSYIGGSNNEDCYGIAIDSKDSIYITGVTNSTDYPTTEGAYQRTLNGDLNAFVSKIAPVKLYTTFSQKPQKAKLLDPIKATLNIINLSVITIDINVKFISIDSSIEFIPNSLCVQGVKKYASQIPSQIYLGNILSNNIAEISLDFKYVKSCFTQKIPIAVEVEIYHDKFGEMYLFETIKEVFYINGSIGPNYIPGCNQFYNLEINNKLQTTASGIPKIYYKSGTSYIYIEPSENKYVYKVLENPDNVVEYLIKI